MGNLLLQTSVVCDSYRYGKFAFCRFLDCDRVMIAVDVIEGERVAVLRDVARHHY